MSTSDGHVYLLIDDVHYLMARWAKRKGFTVPRRGFFTMLFGRLQDATADAIGDAAAVQVIGADVLIDQARTLLEERVPGLPVVCMDRPLADAAPPDLLVSYESTRLIEYQHSRWEKVGHGPRPGCPPIEEQVARIAARLGAGREVAVLDDVHFEGKSLQACITMLAHAGLRVRCAVIGIRKEPERHLPLVDPTTDPPTEIPEHHVLRYPPGRLFDAVDGRDLVFGCPEGGRVVAESGNGSPVPRPPYEYAVPYLHRFGDTEDWASIPAIVPEFTQEALAVAMDLYRTIARLSDRPVRMRDIGRWPCLAESGKPLSVDPDALITDVIADCREMVGCPAIDRMPSHV